ncbi:MAG TPA: hypothetical protein VK469_18555, partial [Candidatus Kapabacteria bacterium]|nr:hypothetical protein [Candidatus Kapabacteria bacterium]
ETLASLNSIWTENIPRKGLIKQFQQFYGAQDYKEAAHICSNLIAQGLDYIDTIDIGVGSLLPLNDESEAKILQFNENSISIFNLNLEMIHRIDVPQNQKIIDVVATTNYSSFHGVNKGDINLKNKIKVLLENESNCRRWVINLANDHKSFDLQTIIEVPGKYIDYNHLSYFQDHILLVGEQSIIQHCLEQGWEQWLPTEDKITCFKEIEDYYWIGIANGHIRIIQDFEKKKIRKSFNRFSTYITSISSHGKYAAAAGTNEWAIATLWGDSIIEPIKHNSPINQIIFLNDNVLAILQDNSMLLGQDIRTGSLLWQINLEDRYDSLLKMENRIYCKKENGPVKLFILPDTQGMIQNLKIYNTTITEGPLLKDPTAPVRDWIDFFDRNSFLEDIKKKPQTHFFISGVPKIGKTSLLYILSDFLSVNSRCCYIDMRPMNKEYTGYDTFAEDFYRLSLSQHGISREVINFTGFQWLQDVIKKVRGSKDYCVFCLDNFVPPKFTDIADSRKFNQLIKEIYVLQNTRLILTYCKSEQKKHNRYFKEINPLSGGKSISEIDLSPFDEEEAKIFIRKTGTLTEQQVEDVYYYTGGFPHLIQLYQGWDPLKSNIKTYSAHIALVHDDIIFAYFRGLRLNVCLILATLLYKDLFSKKISFRKIYDDYPLVSEFLKLEEFKNTLEEIKNYSSAIKVKYDEDNFTIEIEGKPRLFYLVAQFMPWIKELFALYQFSVKPTLGNAHEIIKAYNNLLGFQIEDDKIESSLKTLIDKYYSQFYIRKMCKESRDKLRIPLGTFVVIPLNPWVKGKTSQYFSALYNSLQEYIRKSKNEESPAAKFYIMLFSFIGASSKDLKEEMIGLERVSIIDSQEMSEVLLADSALDKTREILFQQLKISERSPYISSGPVADLFYGRDIEIALVRGLPENIGIFGTRTIGKTSLMLKLYRDLKDLENWQVFALDCGRIDSEEKFLSALADKMGISFSKISNIEKFKKYITQEAETKKVKYLFLLDEVDSLIAYDVGHKEKIFRTFNILCNEPMKNDETVARFVLFGFENMFNQMKNPRSRLYNFMVFLPLRTLGSKNALELVTRPMANIFVKWQNNEDAQYLVDQCSGHPWLLQAACHTLLKILEEKTDKNDIIEKKNVDQALFHNDFRQLCLRPYESITLDINKITTLAALLFHKEKNRDLFSLNDLREELDTHGVRLSPNEMYSVITRLCMYGIFSYVGAPDIFINGDKGREDKIRESIQKNKIKSEKLVEITLKESEIFDIQKEYCLEFKY